MSEHLRDAVAHLRAAVASIDERVQVLEDERQELLATRGTLVTLIGSKAERPPAPAPAAAVTPEVESPAMPTTPVAPAAPRTPDRQTNVQGGPDGCEELILERVRGAGEPVELRALLAGGRFSAYQVKHAVRRLVSEGRLHATGATHSRRFSLPGVGRGAAAPAASADTEGDRGARDRGARRQFTSNRGGRPRRA